LSRRSSTSSARSRDSRAPAQISERCERAFDSLAQAGWHVAKLRLQTDWLRRTHPAVERDSDALTTLRMVLMKPGHAPIVDELAAAVSEHLAGA
jgi:hypothetical protein